MNFENDESLSSSAKGYSFTLRPSNNALINFKGNNGSRRDSNLGLPRVSNDDFHDFGGMDRDSDLIMQNFGCGDGIDDAFGGYSPEDEITRLYYLCQAVSNLRDSNADDDNASHAHHSDEDGEDGEVKKETPKERAARLWNAIRRWIRKHPDEEVKKMAADQVGDGMQTALHLACRAYDPPVDVITMLINCSPSTVMALDVNKWIPLHYACANEVSMNVIETLVESYPEGKLQQDQRGRTPLHFKLGWKNTNAVEKDENDEVIRSARYTKIIKMLSDNGAAELMDEKDMLPLHYACAFQATADTVQVLLDAYPRGVYDVTRMGQTALHIAMVNSKTAMSPQVIGSLLSFTDDLSDKDRIMSKRDANGRTPISMLVGQAKACHNEQERENISKYLTTFLNHEPPSSTDLMTALQELPEAVRYDAVVNINVQKLLNERIARRFHTFILIMDTMMMTMLIICFKLAANTAINQRIENPDNPETPSISLLFPLYTGATYFLLREILQVGSLLSMGKVSTWYEDSGNYMDMLLIALVYSFTIMMHTNSGNNYALTTGVAATVFILWFNVIVFIKSMFVDFAVFYDGIVYVLTGLLPFFTALFIILIAFAMVFFIIFFRSELCNEDINFAHCTFGNSLMRVYSMMMGEVDVGNYMYTSFTIIVFLIYSFLVIILLGNVLIAIVTDAYGVIKDERAEMVFWDNRLNFVAEMDVISEKLLSLITSKKDHFNTNSSLGLKEIRDPFRDNWAGLMNLLVVDQDTNKNWTNAEYLCNLILRIITATIIVPMWFFIGFISIGLLWPPQIREWLLVQGMTSSSRESSQMLQQITNLNKEVRQLKEEIADKIKKDKWELEAKKTEAEKVQVELISDIIQVKDIMSTLLNLKLGLSNKG